MTDPFKIIDEFIISQKLAVTILNLPHFISTIAQPYCTSTPEKTLHSQTDIDILANEEKNRTNTLASGVEWVQRSVAYKTDIESLLVFLLFIKESEYLRFTILTDLFGVDFPDRPKRFEIVYNLLSLKLNKRLLIKIDVGEDEIVHSATKIFNAACWYERELYDMFGVNFDGSHDIRRILTDYNFVGHPLRKDFPLVGHVQVRYDNISEKVIYESVKLEQEFREFDFSSSWQGPNYILAGDEKATK